MIKNFLKKIYISKTISSLVNLVGSPWKGRGVILMYHRVMEDKKMNEDSNHGLAVSCSNFEKQLKILKSRFDVCSLSEFINNLEKKSNKFMVTITFDDGYKDNLFNALPILEKFEIPASIYISTRFLNKEVDMWWYEINDVIQTQSNLFFDYEKKKFNFILKNQKQKLFAYRQLSKLFINLKINDQIKLLEKITNTQKRKNYSEICLNPEEVKILAKHPLITIGSHGHNHLNLKILKDEEIRHEINQSSKILENLLGCRVKHFCYPYGGKKQASAREYNMIKEFKFCSAVTSRVFPIRNYNLFALPRIYIGENTCDKTLINHISGFYNLTNQFL